MKKINYLFIDEYQDINKIQHSIVSSFSTYIKGLIVVGDDNQNIYTWRGSNVKYIRDFLKEYPYGKRYYLNINYRSTTNIINIANEIINKKESSSNANMAYGNVCKMYSYNKKFLGIVPNILYFYTTRREIEYICKMIINSKLKKHHIAVLTRTNGLLFAIETELTRLKVPTQLIAGQDIHEEKRSFRFDHVCLSTIHSAKGLEWDTVFISGVHDKYIPFNKLEIEEERRLFYVAITRAKQQLIMTYSGVKSEISRFILDIETSNIESTNLLKKEDFTPVPLRIIKNYGGVSEIIRKLTGYDYINLKKQHVIIPFRFNEQKLYPSIEYPEFVQKLDIYQEFGCFIDYLIRRMLADRFPRCGGYQDKRASNIIARVILYSEDYKLFNQYEDSIRSFTSIPSMKSVMERVSSDRCQAIKILSIIHNIQHNCKLFSIDQADIVITNRPALPMGELNKMRGAYLRYQNRENKWDEIIKDIFLVSRCHSISYGRSRILYKKVSTKKLLSLLKWYKQIEAGLKKVIPDITNFVMCNPSLTIPDLTGDCDLIFDDCLVDFKNSFKDEINIEHVLQMLYYTYMARQKGIKIKKIILFNPMLGKWCKTSVEHWTNGHKLTN